MRRIVPYVIFLIIALPMAIVVTFVCSPFWNWFESKTSIESFGHSGPADWCFAFTYLLLLVIGSAAAWTLRSFTRRDPSSE